MKKRILTILEETNIMVAKVVDLVVDFEDCADWLQDSIVIENVETPVNRDELLERVIKTTRSMYTPPSKHLEIMGYTPADSDVTVRSGVNFWTSPNNIFAQ